MITLQWRNLAKTTFTKWSGSTSPVSRGYHCLCHDVLTVAPLWHSLQKPITTLALRKTPGKLKCRNILQKTGQYSSKWPKSWKTRQDWETVAGQRRLTCQLNVLPIGLWKGKRTVEENWWNLNQVWSLVSSNTAVLASWVWQTYRGDMKY